MMNKILWGCGSQGSLSGGGAAGTWTVTGWKDVRWVSREQKMSQEKGIQARTWSGRDTLQRLKLVESSCVWSRREWVQEGQQKNILGNQAEDSSWRLWGARQWLAAGKASEDLCFKKVSLTEVWWVDWEWRCKNGVREVSSRQKQRGLALETQRWGWRKVDELERLTGGLQSIWMQWDKDRHQWWGSNLWNRK